MKKCKKLLALLVVLCVAFSQVSVNTFAATEQTSVAQEATSLVVSAMDGYEYLQPRQTMKVKPGTAAEYGFENDASVKADQVTVLDVLVAVTKSLYGDKFTKETAAQYLVVSNGWISTVFGKSASIGFTVNGEQPNDGNYVDSGWGVSAMGYMANQAVVKENDVVEFFVYQDAMATDSYSWFEQDSKKTETVETKVGQKETLTLKGYSIGWYGCNTKETIAENTKAISDMQIVTVDEKGQITPLQNVVTNEKGEAEISFDKAGSYLISAIGTKTATENGSYIIMPLCKVNVYDEPTYEDDLWLQYDYKELAVNETADIYPRRVPQVIDSPITNNITRPNFHFEIVSGDSVKLSKTESTEKTSVTAVKAGTTIVKVTYDAVEANGKVYAACAKENTGYVVFNVPAAKTDITIESNIAYSSYDTIYFAEGDTTDYTFAPTVKGAASYKVTCNGKEIEAKDGKYTLPLENRSNIIGIVAKDDKGNKKSFYQVLDARKITVKIENVTKPGKKLSSGDTAKISFVGITMPVYKLASIYNPTMYMPAWGGKGTFVSYENPYATSEEEKELKGYCNQYDLATQNSFTVTCKRGGTYTLTNGRIFSSWWGSGLGADKTVEGKNKPNLNAPVLEGYFSKLPDVTLKVEKTWDEFIEDLSKLPRKEPEQTTPGQTTPSQTTAATTKEDTTKDSTKVSKKESTVTAKQFKKTATKLSLKKSSKNTAKLQWKKVKGAVSYKVYKKIGKGKYRLVKTVKTLSYTDKKGKKNQKAAYKIVAVAKINNKKVTSKDSNVIKKNF